MRVDEKSDNGMLPGAVQKSPGFILWLRKSPENLSFETGGCTADHRLKWGHFEPSKVGMIRNLVVGMEKRKRITVNSVRDQTFFLSAFYLIWRIWNC